MSCKAENAHNSLSSESSPSMWIKLAVVHWTVAQLLGARIVLRMESTGPGVQERVSTSWEKFTCAEPTLCPTTRYVLPR